MENPIAVGTKIDLTYMNDKPVTPYPLKRQSYENYLPGTKVTFKVLSCGVMLMAILEPAIAINIHS